MRTRNERGSIPLALLVVIVVVGLMTVTLANVVAAQRQVRFDQSYTGALPVAEAPIERVQFMLNADVSIPHESGTPRLRADFAVGDTTGVQSGVLDGSPFQWEATRINDLSWEIRSSGTENGVRRTLVATIEERPLPHLAAFSDKGLVWGGGNRADSYNSDTLQQCTGNGVVASNETLQWNGSATPGSNCAMDNRTVDRAELHNWEGNAGTGTSAANPGGTRCVHPSGLNCQYVNDDYPAVKPYGPKLDLASPEAVAFIAEQIDTCKAAAGGSLPTFKASATPTLEPRAEGDPYCFADMDFDVSGEWVLPASATPDNPVVVFVEGQVRLKGEGGQPAGAAVVACGSPCTVSPPASRSMPKAGSLLIYVKDGPVLLDNSSVFAGVIYAPSATCKGQGAGNHVHVFGSIICGTMSSAGGWQFHYDDALAGVGSGKFDVASWAEDASVPVE